MNFYTLTLYLHVTSAIVSISFFMLRGYWMLTENQWLNHKFVKISPHIIDTLLLASAIALSMLISQYPFVTDWLTVKLFALIMYIVIGTIALKRGKTKTIRSWALAAAILAFGFILTVAYYHHPLGLFALL